MKSIILAAGYGKRMHPLTLNTHKALLKVGNRTLLQTIIDGLLDQGIQDIVIVVGFQAQTIQDHVSLHYPHLKVQYVCNERYAQTNNIVSLALALSSIVIDQDILLIECDLVYDNAVLKRLLSSPYPNVALVDRYRTGMDGTVLQLSGSLITDVITPQRQGEDFRFDDKYKTVNMYKFSKEFCQGPFKNFLDYYAKTIENSYYELVLGIIIYMQHQNIYAEVLDTEKWMEVDTPNDLAVARFLFDPELQKSNLDRSFGGYWSYPIIDFCFIRNMYFPSGAVLSELKSNLVNCITQYGSSQKMLNLKLSYFVQCAADRLIALNGASQAFPLLAQVFENRSVLIPDPTFGEYKRWFPQADVYADPYTCRNFSLYEVVVLVNPNNPTGAVLASQELYNWASTHPNTQFIVDESFIEFSGQPSLVEFLEKDPLPNLIVIKSLSKNLGVPGLRLGYLYTHNTDVYTYFLEHLPIWNMNAMAEYFIEILLRHRGSLEKSYLQTIEDRESFSAQLSQCPSVREVYKSGGNFILVRLCYGWEATEAWAKALLKNHGIYIKTIEKISQNSETFIRLAVRLPQENARVVELMAQFKG